MNSKNCLKCGKEFYKLKSDSRKYWIEKRFCSIKCGKLGKVFSEDRKRKMGLSKKGNKYALGMIPWNKGKKRPEMTGEKHFRWNGGISSVNEKIRGSLEYKLWQDSVKNRDGNYCQKCGENRVGKIMAHHILNFSTYIELRLAINNGVTLCRDCHKKFHLKYGFSKNTEEQLNEFLSTLTF